MNVSFGDIPEIVIDYIRGVFSEANDKISRTLTRQPSLHEESLDHLLIAELTATPPTFFVNERMAVGIESHWLGGRHMYRRWEVADIAFCVILRQRGKLEARKIALLQTKRLYSKEISVAELDRDDFIIGIGRIIDKTDQLLPLTRQRAFRFDDQCMYGAIHARSEQIAHIEAYHEQHGMSVYYGLYNPVALPYADFHPITSGSILTEHNDLGCRIIPSSDVHAAVARLDNGTSPSMTDLRLINPIDLVDPNSRHGWRLERFVADEVLRCRQGSLVDGKDDPRLQQLLYARSAPISAAIAITIDFDAGAG